MLHHRNPRNVCIYYIKDLRNMTICIAINRAEAVPSVQGILGAAANRYKNINSLGLPDDCIRYAG